MRAAGPGKRAATSGGLWGTKVHAAVKIMNSTVFLRDVMVLLSGPVLWPKTSASWEPAGGLPKLCYLHLSLAGRHGVRVAQRNSTRMPWRTFAWQFLLFLALEHGAQPAQCPGRGRGLPASVAVASSHPKLGWWARRMLNACHLHQAWSAAPV